MSRIAISKNTVKALLRINPKAKDYRQFLDILVSPHTGNRLKEKHGKLVSKSGHTYQIVNNIPILVKQPEEMHVTPPVHGKISRNSETYIVPDQYIKAKRILHLGSGNVECSDPRVVSVDILPLENVDIVCEAEVLPFASNSFDLVGSSAVFEHVYDPLAAIREVKRVLKPGGIFYIDNSYLQPYHGFPSNYFDMTPQANETYLVDDFIMIDSAIPGLSGPIQSLSMFIERFLINLNAAQKKKVLGMSVEAFLSSMKKDLTNNNIFMKDFSEYEKRAMAATHIVTAKKPKHYERKLSKLNKKPEVFENWTRLKREYYTLRIEIMTRYHEIYAYKRFALDIKPKCNFGDIKFPDSLDETLKSLLLKDPLDIDELNRKIGSLKREEKTLTGIRDAVIIIFMKCRE